MSADAANQGFWGRVAVLYAPFVETKDSAYKRLCESIAPYLTEDMRVLELACGTGQLTFALAGRVGAWTATDFSQQMVEEAQKRADGDNIAFAVQDATRLTYGDASFDAVVIANALHIMPNPELALQEIRRVLTPGGLLVAPTFVYEGKLPKMKLWMMEKIGFRTFHKWNSAELATFLRSAGFDVVHQSVLVGSVLPECHMIAKKRQYAGGDPVHAQ